MVSISAQRVILILGNHKSNILQVCVKILWINLKHRNILKVEIEIFPFQYYNTIHGIRKYWEEDWLSPTYRQELDITITSSQSYEIQLLRAFLTFPDFLDFLGFHWFPRLPNCPNLPIFLWGMENIKWDFNSVNSGLIRKLFRCRS